MASVLLLKQSKTSDKQGGAALCICVCVCVSRGSAVPCLCAQCVQQLQLSASVYTVGAILLSERLIDTKSRMVMRDDSVDSADGAFQTHSFSALHIAIQHVYENKNHALGSRIRNGL